MGTLPNNFPPEGSLEIGGLVGASKLGATIGFLATPFFTAPTNGMYQIAFLLRIVSSDGIGTIAASIIYPHSAASAINAAPPALNGDQSVPPKTCWLNAGDVVNVAVTTALTVATTFNVYVAAFRLF